MDTLQPRSYRVRGLRLRWRSWIGLLLCIGLGAGAGAILAPEVPFRFRSKARIVFVLGREQSTLRPELGLVGPTGRSMWEPSLAELRDFQTLLQDPAVIRPAVESAVEEVEGFSWKTAGGRVGFKSVIGRLAEPWAVELGLHGEEDPVDRAVAAWANSLHVEDVWSTPIVELICYATDGEHGEAFLQRVIDNYIKLHVRVYGPASRRSFVQEQLDAARAEHEAAVSALSEFRLETGILHMQREKRDLMLRMMGARQESRDLQASEAGLVARIDEAEMYLEELPEFHVRSRRTSRSPVRSQAEQQVLRSEQELIRMSVLYDEITAFVGRSGELVERLRELVEQEEDMTETGISMGRDSVVVELRETIVRDRTRLEGLRAKREQAVARVEQLRKSLNRLEEQRSGLRRLEDEAVSAEIGLARAIKAARVAETNRFLDEAEITNVKILEPPTSDRFPQRLMGYEHRVAIVLVGALVGFLVWATLIMLRNMLIEDFKLLAAPQPPSDET